MFTVYILFSQKLDRYYIGYTHDITKRLAEHNSGISTFTSKAQDWQVKFQRTFETREEAAKYEKELKGKTSRRYTEWLIAQSGG